jgi:hypothetical protein
VIVLLGPGHFESQINDYMKREGFTKRELLDYTDGVRKYRVS